MAAYYKQKNMRNSQFRDICVLLWGRDLKFASKKGGAQYVNLVEAYRKMARMISTEIVICHESMPDYFEMNFWNLSHERRIKKEYLTKIKKIFLENNIEPQLIKEVYHSGITLHQYIKYLNPQVRLIGIEHGCSTVIGYLWFSSRINKLKREDRYVHKSIRGLTGEVFWP